MPRQIYLRQVETSCDTTVHQLFCRLGCARDTLEIQRPRFIGGEVLDGHNFSVGHSTRSLFRPLGNAWWESAGSGES